jgi:hypothetical protein
MSKLQEELDRNLPRPFAERDWDPELDVTRIPAEDPEAIRDRDHAHIDQLYLPSGKRVGDPASPGVYGDEGTVDRGWAQRRRTRTVGDGSIGSVRDA